VAPSAGKRRLVRSEEWAAQPLLRWRGRPAGSRRTECAHYGISRRHVDEVDSAVVERLAVARVPDLEALEIGIGILK
jgi:hypothetical protein